MKKTTFLAAITGMAVIALGTVSPASACGAKNANAADGKEMAYHCSGDRASCHLSVDGLKSAENCESVRAALVAVPGVKDAKVDMETGKALITFADRSDVKNDALLAAVDKAGFKASVPATMKAMKAAAPRN